jgi:hypothetical protein
MYQGHRGKAQSVAKRTRWMKPQPGVHLEEDILEQMLLLEVYLMRHLCRRSASILTNALSAQD